MANRKSATDYLLKYVDKISPGGDNKKIWEETLSGLSDKQFDDFMKRLESGEEVLSIVSPNFSDNKITVDNNLKVAKELGHDFFERLWLTDPNTGETYLTPEKYMVIDLPLRRQIQLLVKKSSIAEDVPRIDELSGQRASGEKGSALSMPQIQSLYANGLDKSILELIKFRGGDEKGLRLLEKSMRETGAASLEELIPQTRQVKSAQTLGVILKGMHLDNNI